MFGTAIGFFNIFIFKFIYLIFIPNPSKVVWEESNIEILLLGYIALNDSFTY